MAGEQDISLGIGWRENKTLALEKDSIGRAYQEDVNIHHAHQQSVPVVFCAACGRNAASKFTLSRNAFRKIWQFLIRNFKSGFKSKIILY